MPKVKKTADSGGVARGRRRSRRLSASRHSQASLVSEDELIFVLAAGCGEGGGEPPPSSSSSSSNTSSSSSSSTTSTTSSSITTNSSSSSNEGHGGGHGCGGPSAASSDGEEEVADEVEDNEQKQQQTNSPPITHKPIIAPSFFYSPKLNSKVTRQLSDFLTVATQQIPKCSGDDNYIFAPHGLYPPHAGAKGLSPRQMEQRVKRFEFIGRLLAQTLIDSRMLDLDLAPPVFKWLVGREHTLGAED
ncbi:hypothetical protein niasHS_005520 [Heterodera schachtii]|uniref:E3 ubiquitin-protein ligase n=1 Tax=Heterodera schachtii TaxID=97005 RepID=A0ABD2JMP0_HETSC